MLEILTNLVNRISNSIFCHGFFLQKNLSTENHILLSTVLKTSLWPGKGLPEILESIADNIYDTPSNLVVLVLRFLVQFFIRISRKIPYYVKKYF